MTKIKICGLQTIEHALTAVESGADYIGFVFARSKRQVNPDQAKLIIDQLPATVKSVGVFVNESLDTMLEIASYCGLDILQLHGSETLDHYKDSPLPIIKSVSIKSSSQTNNSEDLNLPQSDYLLFDTWHKNMAGGCGEAFDWNALSALSIEKPFFLAGGLNTDNIQEAIQRIKPYAVDISSGVETNGIKDKAKIKSFIQLVKECRYDL